MVDVDAVMRPFWERLQADYGALPLYDAHTHIGADDPDGVRQSPDELLAVLSEFLAPLADGAAAGPAATVTS